MAVDGTGDEVDGLETGTASEDVDALGGSSVGVVASNGETVEYEDDDNGVVDFPPADVDAADVAAVLVIVVVIVVLAVTL